MIADFIIYAERNGINLEHKDDWIGWYNCWVDGYNASLNAYATLRDGKRLVGALERPLECCLLKAD